MSSGKEWSDDQIRCYLDGIACSDYPAVLWELMRPEMAGAVSLIDIGSGPGAFALQAARDGMKVKAVDTSPKCLAVLEAEAEKRRLEGITTICGNWLEVYTGRCDVAVCSYSFGGEIGSVGGIKKILETTERVAFMISPYSTKQTDFCSRPLYSEVGLEPPAFSGNYRDILKILAGLGQRVSWQELTYDFGFPLNSRNDFNWAASFLSEKLGLPSTARVSEHLQNIIYRKGKLLWVPNPRKSVIITWRRSEN
ncbi:MAG: class I SAM-dependent methyltransferase [Bacillota bacterium]